MSNLKAIQQNSYLLFLVILVTISGHLYAQETSSTSTQTRPIKEQYKGVFSNVDSTVFFSNDFSGGRLNQLTVNNDTSYRILIEPENFPINASPWYAFKVWGTTPKTITVTLAYVQVRRGHRYPPKISTDGENWALLEKKHAGHRNDDGSYQFKIDISKDTTWIAAQPLLTVTHVNKWVNSLLKMHIGAKKEVIGQSRNQRPLEVVKIGNPKSKRVVVLMTRQHPPEVTGHQAFMSFVETITANTPQAKLFREIFSIYLFPLANPDGVENGHWRHNTGGIDLNRDWEDFNQPETRAIRDYLKKDIKSNQKVNLFIDFHSIVGKDLYYTIKDDLKKNTSNMLPAWIEHLKKTFPDYQPIVKPFTSSTQSYPPRLSYGYFYGTYQTEAVIYEVSDNTPKDFIVAKAKASAEKLMELLLLEAKKKQ